MCDYHLRIVEAYDITYVRIIVQVVARIDRCCMCRILARHFPSPVGVPYPIAACCWSPTRRLVFQAISVSISAPRRRCFQNNSADCLK